MFYHLRQQLHATLDRMGDDLAAHIDRDIADAGHAFGRRHQSLAEFRHLALGRVAQLHIK